jgi:RNA polymerase sigma-70 factor, ECF subfamily
LARNKDHGTVDAQIDDQLADLLRAGLAGDDRAYARFLEQAAAILRAFVRRKIVYGGIDPEDIVQETLLAIHLKRHTWQTDAAVMPWVHAIAKFKLVDAFRRQGRRVEIDIDDVVETLAQPETDRVSDREIDHVLAALAEGQRVVVTSVSVEGRSIKETAMVLGMSEPAVRVALHRGLAAIARRFGRS